MVLRRAFSFPFPTHATISSLLLFHMYMRKKFIHFLSIHIWTRPLFLLILALVDIARTLPTRISII